MAQTKPSVELTTEQLVTTVLNSIDREREREIVARRFGLFERKETLEQIGEMLGITRERVRQLEKSVVTRLRTTAEQGAIANLADFQTKLLGLLHAEGEAARISHITSEITSDPNREEQSRVTFLAQLCPELTVVQEDDNFYNSVGVKAVFDEKTLKDRVENLVATIKKIGEPKSINEIAKAAGITNSAEAQALASTSKKLATLNNRWDLLNGQWLILRTSKTRFTLS